MDNLNNNFNIAEMQAQIYGLPSDVQGYMLSFINDFDFETLKSANLVSKLWHNTIQTLSRQLADRYFPYCKDTQHNAHQDYKNNPLKLLSSECKRYQNELESTSLEGKMSLTLAALSGDKGAIEAEKNQKPKKLAYSFFFANGHTCSLEGFSKEDKNYIMGRALMYTARNGYLLVVQHLLNAAGADIDALEKGWALQLAAKNGHLLVVQYLLNIIGEDIRANGHKEIALLYAAKNGHLHIIKAINGWDLRMAATEGDVAEIQALLTNQEPGQEISSEDKGLALIMAAQYGHLNIMETLLQRTGKEISLEYKEGALDVLEHTDGNDNEQKTNLITLLQMHTLTEQMIADFAPATMFTPNYQAVGENSSLLKRKHDGSEEENRDTKKRKENPGL